MGFPGGSAGKESACNVGDLGQEDPLEKGKATHSGIQAWRITWTIALVSHASKVMLKILQARLQKYVNHEILDVQASLRKGRGTRDQIANICCIIKTAREFQKKFYFCFIDYTKAFD